MDNKTYKGQCVFCEHRDNCKYQNAYYHLYDSASIETWENDFYLSCKHFSGITIKL